MGKTERNRGRAIYESGREAREEMEARKEAKK